MIDVRLTATNPEDSTLVPVPCNARGELLTVAPKIESIPNDVEIDGDLTVTGSINGSIGGGGSEGPPGPEGPQGPEGPPGPNELLPYGDENDVLQINGGIPVWQPLYTPPPPIVGPYAGWTNVDTTANCTDSNGNAIFPPDNLEYLEGLDSWLDTTSKDLSGSSQPVNNLDNPDQWFEFAFQEAFGYVFTLYWSVLHNNPTTTASRWAVTWACDHPDVNLIQTLPSGWGDQGSNRDVWVTGKSVFTINRDISSAKFSWNLTCGHAIVKQNLFRGWTLVDPGTYALNNQLRLEKELADLRQILKAE
jgi:hypothetical protein